MMEYCPIFRYKVKNAMHNVNIPSSVLFKQSSKTGVS